MLTCILTQLTGRYFIVICSNREFHEECIVIRIPMRGAQISRMELPKAVSYVGESGLCNDQVTFALRSSPRPLRSISGS